MFALLSVLYNNYLYAAIFFLFSCWEELGIAVKTQIHETSLYFEEKQRQ